MTARDVVINRSRSGSTPGSTTTTRDGIGTTDMTVDNPQIKTRDIRGVAIEPGCKVVACDLRSDFSEGVRVVLAEYTVKEVLLGPESGDLARICVDREAGYYTPNQVAVVEAAVRKLDEPRTDRERFGGYPGTDTYAVKPPEHLVSVGVDTGGWRANCSCGAQFPWHQIAKRGRKAKGEAQEDAAAHLRVVAKQATEEKL